MKFVHNMLTELRRMKNSFFLLIDDFWQDIKLPQTLQREASKHA